MAVRKKASGKKPPVKTALEREIKQVERYEYLLVEYLKEISNEMTYLVLVIVSLFLYVMLDLIPTPGIENYELVRIVFVVIIIGGFGMFGFSNITKRRIEKKFEKILN